MGNGEPLPPGPAPAATKIGRETKRPAWQTDYVCDGVREEIPKTLLFSELFSEQKAPREGRWPLRHSDKRNRIPKKTVRTTQERAHPEKWVPPPGAWLTTAQPPLWVRTVSPGHQRTALPPLHKDTAGGPEKGSRSPTTEPGRPHKKEERQSRGRQGSRSRSRRHASSRSADRVRAVRWLERAATLRMKAKALLDEAQDMETAAETLIRPNP